MLQRILWQHIQWLAMRCHMSRLSRLVGDSPPADRVWAVGVESAIVWTAGASAHRAAPPFVLAHNQPSQRSVDYPGFPLATARVSGAWLGAAHWRP